MTKRASARGFEPIDLGFKMDSISLGKGDGFVIDLGMPKLEPCIPNDAKHDITKQSNDMSLIGGIGGFTNDISKTIHDTKQDYDNFVKSTKLMKQDLTPSFDRIKTLISKLIKKVKKK